MDLHLGKGVVLCKDTPNFIGNRIGCFWGAKIAQLTEEGDYTVEEVDALTGPLIGLPKSASFRLMDIVGLDVWVHVLRNLYEAVPDDPARELFRVPDVMQQMLDRGWLGEKRSQGFYKRVGKGAAKEILVLDRKTLEYHPAQKPSFPSVEAARGIDDLGTRLRALVAGDDRAGRFLWPLFRDFFIYSAQMVPEISDRVVEIDRAMRWGYAFAKGPFEYWDALGVPATVERMHREGVAVPPGVERMLAGGARTFYQDADRDGEPHTCYFVLNSGAWAEIEPRPGVVVLAEVKRARGVVQSNPGASLVDLGDGVLCLEFHSKMNTLGGDAVSMLQAGLDETARNFQAMVVANDGEHFSAGANLMLVLLAAQDGEWDELDAAVRAYQNAMMAMKYAPFPVVAAPFGMTLGGGLEVALHTARIQASAESYMGLVEAGVGVVPAGGGCKELVLRVRRCQTRLRSDRLRKGQRERRSCPRARLPAPRRRHHHEPRAAALRRQGGGAGSGAFLGARAAAPGYRGGGRGRIRAAQNGRAAGARGRPHLRIRCRDRRQTGVRGVRRPTHRNPAGERAIPSGPGARSLPEPVRQPPDPGTHAVHAEERETVEELTHA